MRNFLRKERANSTIEYCLFITVCIFAIIGMQSHLKRGIEGGWRRQIDQMAGQFSSAHENITTVVSEYTHQNEAQAKGITNVTVSQSVLRITDEKIGSKDSESQIGI